MKQPQLFQRIDEKLAFVSKNPFRNLKHYEGEPHYKWRLGSYRFVIDVDFKEKVLFIVRFDHRKKVYKR